MSEPSPIRHARDHRIVFDDFAKKLKTLIEEPAREETGKNQKKRKASKAGARAPKAVRR